MMCSICFAVRKLLASNIALTSRIFISLWSMAMFLINASIGSRFVGFCLRNFCRRAVFTLIALIRTSACFWFFFVPTETKLVGFFPSAHRTSHRRVVQVQNWWGETVFVHFYFVISFEAFHFYLMFPLHAFKLKMVFMFPFFHLHFTLPVLEIRFVFISPKLLLAPPAVCTPFHIAATWSHASDKFSTHFSLFFRRSISEPVDGTTPICTTTALIWLLFATLTSVSLVVFDRHFWIFAESFDSVLEFYSSSWPRPNCTLDTSKSMVEITK